MSDAAPRKLSKDGPFVPDDLVAIAEACISLEWRGGGGPRPLVATSLFASMLWKQVP